MWFSLWFSCSKQYPTTSGNQPKNKHTCRSHGGDFNPELTLVCRDEFLAKKEGWQQDLLSWQEDLASETDPDHRRFIEQEIEQCSKILDVFERVEKGEV